MSENTGISIRHDLRGDLDEVVGFGCYVHLERMNPSWFCLIVSDTDRSLTMSIAASSEALGKVEAAIYSEEFVTAEGVLSGSQPGPDSDGLSADPPVDAELERLGLPQSWNAACEYALTIVPDGLSCQDRSPNGHRYMDLRNAFNEGARWAQRGSGGPEGRTPDCKPGGTATVGSIPTRSTTPEEPS